MFKINFFSYELNSNVYLVSAILETSKLNIWFWKKFSESYASKAADALMAVAYEFVPKDLAIPKTKITKKFGNDDDDDLFYRLHRDNDEEDETKVRFGNSNGYDLRREKEVFFSLINKPLIEGQELLTTKMFWAENRKQLPNLHKLAKRLLTIPASSAFIERFFSVCGVV
jgi:hypothetical protein